MKVKELIAELRECDPEMTVRLIVDGVIGYAIEFNGDDDGSEHGILYVEGYEK